MANFIKTIQDILNSKSAEEKLFDLISDARNFQKNKFFKIINKTEKIDDISDGKYSPVSFVNLNVQNSEGNTPLHLLAGKQTGSVILSEYLITKGADANLLNANGESPLKTNINLIGIKDAQLIKETQHTLLNKIYNDGETILTALFQKRAHIEPKLVQEIINQGADINLKNQKGHSPLYYTLFLHPRSMPQIFFTLIENGASFSKKDIEKLNLFNQINKYSFLILGCPNNKKLTEKDALGNTLLFKMLKTPIDYTFGGRFDVYSLSNEIVKEQIIEKIINLSDIHEKDADEKSALELAVLNHRYQFISKLIEKGANTSFKNEKGETLLHIAVLRNDEKLLKTLLEKNQININTTDNDGNTPLHLAVKKEKVGLIELLLNKEANPLIQNKEGLSALLISSKCQSEVIFLKLQLKKLEMENQKLNASLIAHRTSTQLIVQNRQLTL